MGVGDYIKVALSVEIYLLYSHMPPSETRRDLSPLLLSLVGRRDQTSKPLPLLENLFSIIHSLHTRNVFYSNFLGTLGVARGRVEHRALCRLFVVPVYQAGGLGLGVGD